MSPLLDHNPISCYWLGFLLADAHFDLKRKSCILVLAKKDEDTVRKFASFVSCFNIREGHHNSIGVRIYSEDLIPKLCDRFSVKNDKTRNPPDLSAIKNNKTLMLAMLIGLIDGDGCIFRAKDCRASYMKLMCHTSWTGIYQHFCDFLISNFSNNGEKPHCYVNFSNKNKSGRKNKYLNFVIYDNYLLKTLKREAIRMNLPIMDRKWDKVDLEYVAEREETPVIMSVVKKLVNKGLDKKEIMKITSYTESRVKWAMKKIKIQQVVS